MNREKIRTWGAPPAMLALGGVAGWLANRVGIPLAWMVGPLVVTAIATLSLKLPRLPVRARYVGQVIVGSAVGLYLSPEALDRILENAVPIVLGSLIITAAACIIAIAQIRLAGANPATAVFSNVPGGPVDMAFLAGQYGGDPARTALAQTLRVTMVVLVLPPILIGFSDDVSARVYQYGTLADSAVLIAAGGVAGLLFRYLRLINPYFLGPMIVIGAATALGVDLSHFHEGFVPAGQVLLGVSLGGMFQRSVFQNAGRFIVSLVMTSALLLLISAVTAELIVALFSADLPTMVLANAPGGVPEMVITAQVLHLDVPLVASFQFVRIIFSLSVAALLFRAVSSIRFLGGTGGRLARPADECESKEKDQ